MLADGWAEQAREDARVRALALASGRAVDEAVPVAESPSQGPEGDADVDYDYSAVEWDEGASADDWERMQAALGQTRVTVAEGVPEGLVDDPPVPDVDFDREWT